MAPTRRQVATRILLVTAGATDVAEVRALARAIERQPADDKRVLRVRVYPLSELPQQAPAADAAMPLAAVIAWIGAGIPEQAQAHRRFFEQTDGQCRRAGVVFLSIVDEAASSALRAFAQDHGLLAQRPAGGLDPHACAYAIRAALKDADRRVRTAHTVRAKNPAAEAAQARQRDALTPESTKIDVTTGRAVTPMKPLRFERPFEQPAASAPVGSEAAEPAAAEPAAVPGATRGMPSPPATRGLTPPEAESAVEPVRLGASAPRSLQPGDEFTARFVAYLQRDEGEVGALLTRLSARSEHALNVGECQWKIGTLVTVRVSGRHLQVSPAEQSFKWDGKRAMLDFDVTVEPTAPESTVVLKFDAAVDDIVIARVRLDLGIRLNGKDTQAQSATVDSARTAFASYSSQDRERVTDRVAAVTIATGLKIFLDCMSLNPGEQWKKRLAEEIRASDLFLLFWSAASATSPWVEWEWRTALAEKGRDAMQIHPLESQVKPPDELKDLHFSDVHMLVREATLAQRATPR